MMNTDKAIDTFLSSTAFGVAGASTNRHKYGNKVLRCYLQNNMKAYPINPNQTEIEGLATLPTVNDLPSEVKSLSIITPPPITEKIVVSAIQHGIKNIWMQPGAESDKAIQLCEENNINVGIIRTMSPLQEMDGYYVLMDWVEKPRLRQTAVIWLVKKFPKALRHPKLFKQNWQQNSAEIYYWIACILFLILICGLTLVLQHFILLVFGYENTNPYLSLILPFLVITFSSFSIIADIRNQAED